MSWRSVINVWIHIRLLAHGRDRWDVRRPASCSTSLASAICRVLSLAEFHAQTLRAAHGDMDHGSSPLLPKLQQCVALIGSLSPFLYIDMRHIQERVCGRYQCQGQGT